tara:strand:- start:62 stop:424 length:363 start_codon:yes stop_codon:yes gene_type:complete
MIKTNNIYSVYVICIYLLLVSMFLFFHEGAGIKVNESLSEYIIKERAVFYFLSSFLFLQIYLVSEYLYFKLINTFSLIFFLFLYIQPLNDLLFYSWQVWVLSAINLFLILLMQTERYYYK